MPIARPVVKTGPAFLRVSIDLARPPERVWPLLTQASHIAVWWSERLQLLPELDGRLRDLRRAGAGWALTSGRITAFDPPAVLEMTWAEDTWPAATRLALHLAAIPQGTALTLNQTGWNALPPAGRQDLIDAYAADWGGKLGLLAAYAADSV